MSDKPQDLKPRTKEFALRIIRMYSKEIEETEYWLELLVDSGCIPQAKMAALLDETRQLIAIFTTIDKRAKGDR